MRAILAAAVAAATLTCAAPALAQDSNSGAQAQNVVNVNANAGEYGPSRQTVRHEGGAWSTPVVQGGYISGANPCLVGTGGGAAAGPIGINISMGKSDEGCQRRSDAAAWNAMGMQGVAMARMCQDQKSADAFFVSTGMACPGTRQSGRYKRTDGTLATEMRLTNSALTGQVAPAAEQPASAAKPVMAPPQAVVQPLPSSRQ